MIYYNQYDYPNVPYPAPGYENATIKSGGCGVCCASIIVENLTREKFPPPESAQFSINCGARASGGTNMGILAPAISKKYSLSYSATNDAGGLVACLNDGGMAIANAGGDRGAYKGVFSNGGHYIVAAAVSGKIVTILDPGQYKGKYDTAYRSKFVTTNGNEVYAAIATLEKDCDNRSPRYHLFTGPVSLKEELDMTKEELLSTAGTGDKPTPWAKKATEYCKEKGIFNGDGAGNYGWQQPITREAVAQILYNTLEAAGLLNTLQDK